MDTSAATEAVRENLVNVLQSCGRIFNCPHLDPNVELSTPSLPGNNTIYTPAVTSGMMSTVVFDPRQMKLEKSAHDLKRARLAATNKSYLLEPTPMGELEGNKLIFLCFPASYFMLCFRIGSYG